MEENAPQSPTELYWPLTPITQGTLRRWLQQEESSSTRYVVWRVLDNVTSQAVANVQGGDFEIPFDGTLIAVYAFVDTAGVTGAGTYDINVNGSGILSTKITIDTTEKTSRTAATPPVISVSTITTGDIFTVDVDGIQTTPAKGLSIVLVLHT